MKKNILTLSLLGCVTSLTACNSTLQTTWDKTKTFADDHRGLLVGCVSGAALGYVTKGEKGALVGMVAGCGIGQYYDHQRKKMKTFAQESNMDVVLDEVEVSVLDTDDKTQTNTKLLSSSFVNNTSMFATGSTQLSEDAEALVKKLAADYKSSGTAVMVVGHSDSSGSSAANKTLSEKRARVVAKMLVSNGVSKEKIYYQGAGESQPIAPNTSDEGRSLNRRVEFVEMGVAAVLQASESEVKSLPKEVTDRSFVEYAAVQQTQLRNAAYREGKAAISAKQALIDFGGEKVDADQSPLYKYLGEPEPPVLSFGLFQKAYADTNSISKTYSCLESEPVSVGEVKSLSGKIEHVAQHEYVPGMNNSVWLSNVNGHLVSVANVKVTKDNFRVLGTPEGSVYENYKGGEDQPAYKGKAVAETFEGNNTFLYRVHFTDSNRPLECMDIVMPKNSKGSHQAVAGLIYYQDKDGVKTANFKPKKI